MSGESSREDGSGRPVSDEGGPIGRVGPSDPVEEGSVEAGAVEASDPERDRGGVEAGAVEASGPGRDCVIVIKWKTYVRSFVFLLTGIAALVTYGLMGEISLDSCSAAAVVILYVGFYLWSSSILYSLFVLRGWNRPDEGGIIKGISFEEIRSYGLSVSVCFIYYLVFSLLFAGLFFCIRQGIVSDLIRSVFDLYVDKLFGSDTSGFSVLDICLSVVLSVILFLPSCSVMLVEVDFLRDLKDYLEKYRRR